MKTYVPMLDVLVDLHPIMRLVVTVDLEEVVAPLQQDLHQQLRMLEEEGVMGVMVVLGIGAIYLMIKHTILVLVEKGKELRQEHLGNRQEHYMLAEEVEDAHN